MKKERGSREEEGESGWEVEFVSGKSLRENEAVVAVISEVLCVGLFMSTKSECLHCGIRMDAHAMIE